jgi:hypothetical protein
MATNPHITIEELLETAFSTRSMPRSYKKDNWSKESVCEAKTRRLV